MKRAVGNEIWKEYFKHFKAFKGTKGKKSECYDLFIRGIQNLITKRQNPGDALTCVFAHTCKHMKAFQEVCGQAGLKRKFILLQNF